MMQVQWHPDHHYQERPYQHHHKQYHLFVIACLWLILILACGHVAVQAQLTPAQQVCVGPVESLLVCLPYTQGKTPLPTPACCAKVANVFHTQKKCLCELVAASFTGTPGVPQFNQTLALALPLPSVCNVPADPSECPGELGIPPSSPEAKIFDNAPGSSKLPSSSPNSKGTPSSATVTTTAQGSNIRSSSGSSSSSNSKEAMKAAPLLLSLSVSLLFRLIM